MKRYAIVIDDLVTNVALWDGVTHWQPEGEVIELDDDSSVGPGWTYDDGEWVSPPPTAEELAMREMIKGKD